MRHGKTPAPVVARGNVRERAERGFVLFHGAAPHDRVELGKLDGLSLQPSDHVDMLRAGGEVVTVVDGVRAQAVVVPGQDHDRLVEAIQLRLNERDGLVGHAVVIEEIARDQQQIDPIRQRAIDDAPEDVPATLGVRGLLFWITVAIAGKMDVGGVKHSQGASWRGHAP